MSKELYEKIYEQYKNTVLKKNLITDDEEFDIKGFDVNIESETLNNENYRKVLYTTDEMQLVVMSIKPGEEIGMETHEGGSQFIRIEGGTGKAIIEDREIDLKDGSSIVVPSGVNHNVINTGNDDLKLYAVYAPPEHEDGLIQKDKEVNDMEESIKRLQEALNN